MQIRYLSSIKLGFIVVQKFKLSGFIVFMIALSMLSSELSHIEMNIFIFKLFYKRNYLMKCFISLIVILLFSHSAIAQQPVTIANDIFNVYKLHGEVAGKPPIPALFIYDSQTQKIMSPQKVFNIFSRDKTLTTMAVKGITVFTKKTSTATISQTELEKASRFISIDTRYVAFFHNMGQGMAASFPEFPELLAAEKAIIKHLSAQDDVSLYTLM